MQLKEQVLLLPFPPASLYCCSLVWGMTFHLVLKHTIVLDPLVNLPTQFPWETLDKIPCIIETRHAKHKSQARKDFFLPVLTFCLGLGLVFLLVVLTIQISTMEFQVVFTTVWLAAETLLLAEGLCPCCMTATASWKPHTTNTALFDLTNSFSSLCCLCAECACFFVYFMLLL